MDHAHYERLRRDAEAGDEHAAQRLYSEASRRGEPRTRFLARLGMPPSESGWAEVCQTLDGEFLSDEQPELIALAQRLLQRWPDALRVAPESWLASIFRGRPRPQLEIVRTVKVGEPRLSPEGARILANTHELRFVNHLDLDWSHIGPEGAAALVSSPYMSQLQTLKLYWNHIEAEGAATLASTPLMARLRHLFLNRNALEDEGVVALAESPYLANLITLKLGANSIHSEGALALAQSPHMARLRRLFLIDNKIGASAKRALRTSPHLAGCKFWF